MKFPEGKPHFRFEHRDTTTAMHFTGIVEKGKGTGAKLGFRTANIPLTDPSVSGIYAGRVTIAGESFAAAIYADQRRGLLESHLLDWEGDLYGKEISVELLKKLREDRAFTDMKELVAQIADDVSAVRACFAETVE